jgi:hypothetical protein
MDGSWPQHDASIVVLDLASALGGSSGGDAAVPIQITVEDKIDTNGASLRATAVEFVPGTAPRRDNESHSSVWDSKHEASELCAQAPEFMPTINQHAHLANGYYGVNGEKLDENDAYGTSAGDQQIYSEENWNEELSASRTFASQICQLVFEFLASVGDSPYRFKDEEGYVPISHLVLQNAPINRKAFGSTQAVARSIKAHGSRTLQLDKTGQRVRMLRLEEVMRAEAASAVSEGPRECTVPLARLIAIPTILQNLSMRSNPEKFVRSALEDDDSRVMIVQDKAGELALMRRPHGPYLRKAIEALLSDEHLAEDARLRTKVLQSPAGDLPLTWLCSRYRDQLGITEADADAQAIEGSAEELCKTLSFSSFLCVDEARLTVRRKEVLQSQGQNLASSQESSKQQPKRSLRNAGLRLQQLLDFYFESFNLQHNRLLLDLVATRAGPPPHKSPWPVDTLSTFSFTLDDLLGLGRIASELGRLRIPTTNSLTLERMIGPLKYLKCFENGQLSLMYPPEIRSFVPSAEADSEVASGAMRYLAVACEQRGQAPPGFVSVLAVNVTEALLDQSDKGDQRRSRLKRQFLLHHTDFICVQGINVNVEKEGLGTYVQTALMSEGYGFVSAQGGQWYEGKESQELEEMEECAIFWDRSRWQLTERYQHDGNVACVLIPFEDQRSSLRVACLRPSVPTASNPDLNGLLGHEGQPLLVCADLSHIGGAEVPSVVEELSSLRSVMREVVGRESPSPIILPDPVASQTGLPPTLGRDGASGLVDTHNPDAVFFRGLSPTAALSCHSAGYLATMIP